MRRPNTPSRRCHRPCPAECPFAHAGEKAILRAAKRRVRDLSSDGFLAGRDQGARERLIAAVV